MAGVDATDQVPVPSWPTCGRRSGETGSPCIGSQVDGFDHCLAHLGPEQLDEALQRFGPGADLQAPGTDISAELLTRILRAVATENEPPTFGSVCLAQAHFTERASFSGTRFRGDATFDGAQFSGNAWFDDTQFSGFATFDGAQFSGYAMFEVAQFR